MLLIFATRMVGERFWHLFDVWLVKCCRNKRILIPALNPANCLHFQKTIQILKLEANKAATQVYWTCRRHDKANKKVNIFRCSLYGRRSSLFILENLWTKFFFLILCKICSNKKNLRRLHSADLILLLRQNNFLVSVERFFMSVWTEVFVTFIQPCCRNDGTKTFQFFNENSFCLFFLFRVIFPPHKLFTGAITEMFKHIFTPTFLFPLEFPSLLMRPYYSRKNISFAKTSYQLWSPECQNLTDKREKGKQKKKEKNLKPILWWNIVSTSGPEGSAFLCFMSWFNRHKFLASLYCTLFK